MLIAGAFHRCTDVVAGERHEEKVPHRKRPVRGSIDVPPDAMTTLGSLCLRCCGLLYSQPFRLRVGPQLVLSADVGQTEFFEDEPIYLLLRLQNVAADTAWTFSSASFPQRSPCPRD